MGLDWLKTKGLHVDKMLAYQVAKGIKREDFLKQLKETWVGKINTTTGAVDTGKELEDMKKRIKSSGYKRAFTNAKVTDKDLEDTLLEAIVLCGRQVKE